MPDLRDHGGSFGGSKSVKPPRNIKDLQGSPRYLGANRVFIFDADKLEYMCQTANTPATLSYCKDGATVVVSPNNYIQSPSTLFASLASDGSYLLMYNTANDGSSTHFYVFDYIARAFRTAVVQLPPGGNIPTGRNLLVRNGIAYVATSSALQRYTFNRTTGAMVLSNSIARTDSYSSVRLLFNAQGEPCIAGTFASSTSYGIKIYEQDLSREIKTLVHSGVGSEVTYMSSAHFQGRGLILTDTEVVYRVDNWVYRHPISGSVIGVHQRISLNTIPIFAHYSNDNYYMTYLSGKLGIMKIGAFNNEHRFFDPVAPPMASNSSLQKSPIAYLDATNLTVLNPLVTFLDVPITSLVVNNFDNYIYEYLYLGIFSSAWSIFVSNFTPTTQYTQHSFSLF